MLCRSCHRELRGALLHVGSFKVVTCSDCGLAQLDLSPDVNVLKELYGASYFKRGKYRSDLADRREQERRLDLLRRGGVADGAAVLDFGCATGSFIRAAKKTFTIWGTDVSVEGIDEAKREHPEMAERLFTTAVDNPSVPKAAFDAVTMWDVVEHLDDPLAVVHAVGESLKPGGILSLSTPNFGALSARLLGRRWAFMTPPEHISFFNRTTLTALLERANFTVIEWQSRGKWVNLGFLLYKARKSKLLPLPENVLKQLLASKLGTLPLYVPSGDIQYLSARLNS